MELIIEKASAGDAPTLAEILREGAAYKAEQGDTVWEWRDFGDEIIREWIERDGNVYAVRLGEIAVATFVITMEDPAMWGPEAGDAAYIHKLAVKRDVAGRGIGKQALDWAGAYAAGQGRDFLRLDVPAANEQLRRYYERQGFAWVRDHDVEMPYGVYEASLYERRTLVP